MLKEITLEDFESSCLTVGSVVGDYVITDIWAGVRYIYDGDGDYAPILFFTLQSPKLGEYRCMFEELIDLLPEGSC